MPFHLTAEGAITKISADHEQAPDGAHVVASRNEWEALAAAWPLKQLVEIWNSLPGVAPVRKFHQPADCGRTDLARCRASRGWLTSPEQNE
jgi:hypothetical protein